MNKIICIAVIALCIGCTMGSVRLQNIDDKIEINSSKLKSHSEYLINVKQQLLLDYEIDQNAYSIQLDEVTSKGLVKQVTNYRTEEEGDDMTAINFDLPNGCTAYKRDFFIDYVIDTIGPDEDYVTDVVVLPKNRKLFILTQNYMIFEAKFRPILIDNNEISLDVEFTTESKSYSSILKQMSGQQELEASNTFGFNTDDESHVYIITKYGAVTFNSSIDMGDDGFGFTKLNFQQRDEIKDILTYRQYVYVVLGEQGVDIYQINDQSHSMSLVYSMNKPLHKNGDVINAERVVINNGLLAVLDTYNGIFFYDITKLPTFAPKIDMEFRLQNIRSFDLRGNTLIIVFEGRLDKVWEVFVDFNTQEFYVNRTYLDEITYTDVRMDKHYAILMSDSAHRIISHSIYKEFTESSLWQQHRYFNQLGLSQLMLLNYVKETGEFFIQRRSYNVDNQLETHQISFLLGAGINRFSVHKVSELHTQIRCVSDVQVEKTYQVTINSTDCTVDKGRTESIGNLVNSGNGDQYSRNNINPFVQCQRIFNMTFIAQGEILQTENVGLVFALVVGTFLFCCFVGCFQLMNYRITKKKRELAEKRWNDLQYQHNMSNIIKDQPSDEQTPQPRGESMQSSQPSQDKQLQQQQTGEEEQQQKASNFQIDDDDDDNEVKYGLDDEEEQKQN